MKINRLTINISGRLTKISLSFIVFCIFISWQTLSAQSNNHSEYNHGDMADEEIKMDKEHTAKMQEMIKNMHKIIKDTEQMCEKTNQMIDFMNKSGVMQNPNGMDPIEHQVIMVRMSSMINCMNDMTKNMKGMTVQLNDMIKESGMMKDNEIQDLMKYIMDDMNIMTNKCKNITDKIEKIK